MDVLLKKARDDFNICLWLGMPGRRLDRVKEKPALAGLAFLAISGNEPMPGTVFYRIPPPFGSINLQFFSLAGVGIGIAVLHQPVDVSIFPG